MPSTLTREDLLRFIAPGSLARGIGYFRDGRVLDLEQTPQPGGLRVDARVRGSGGQIYRQKIWIRQDADERWVNGTCSCPVALNCKHVAAACLALIKQGVAAAPADEAAPEALHGWLGRVARAAKVGATGAADAREECLIYLLSPGVRGAHGVSVELRIARRLKRETGYSKGRQVRLQTLLVGALPACLALEDHAIIGLLRAVSGRGWADSLDLAGPAGGLALTRMVATGRCCWQDPGEAPLQPGDLRRLETAWAEAEDGGLRLTLRISPRARLLLVDPPQYLDGQERLAGPLDTGGLNAAQLTELLAAPRLRPSQAQAIARALVLEFPDLPLPAPAEVRLTELTDTPPVPCLCLTAEPMLDSQLHLLRLEFEYAGHRLAGLPGGRVSVVDGADGPVRIHRDPAAEEAALDRLQGLGYVPVETRRRDGGLRLVPAASNPLERAGRWSALLKEGLPALEAAGWRVETEDAFRLRFERAEWDLEVEDEGGGNDWFGLRFDLDLGGRRVPLLPLLAPLLQLGLNAELPETVTLPLNLDGPDVDGFQTFAELPGARLKPFLDTLRDLFERAATGADGRLRLSRFDAAALAELEERGLALRGGEQLRALARRLKDFSGIEPTEPPAGLTVELRPYQRRGLDWLQFLRAYGLGGILADDMGLGKTVQTLAHLLLEKEQGRLDRPALVVAPTSLMGNWRREAARFAPALRTLVLHGADRHDRFEAIPQHDLILTTYPLLPRDQARLAEQPFHSLILDEAQMVKNPRSQAAAIVRTLRAEHRLCLTGTPMENHLGELWAQFDFLMPGFLGDEGRFRREWRIAIEQHRDPERQERLARRVAPFMLRRRKQDVATELPPKTEIIKSVTLGERQAELYEGIRLSMEKRVREAIAAQGLARSHITILDALLKLRQTCCDPRLLKIPAAERVKESAKLALLMDLLPEQLEEGRRILLFSQFTSMLALIEAELAKVNIAYAKLTGQTRKRDEAIETFRSGAADLFLISLKAGGVGLNLTEADTVILYDPWWNPAAEAQAADRAHRIGQDKPVFVYKLVAEQTVEERILALQEKKRTLAAGVYRETADEGPAFGPGDLEALFAPTGP